MGHTVILSKPDGTPLWRRGLPPFDLGSVVSPAVAPERGAPTHLSSPGCRRALKVRDKPGVGAEKDMVPGRGPTLISPLPICGSGDRSWTPTGAPIIYASYPGFLRAPRLAPGATQSAAPSGLTAPSRASPGVVRPRRRIRNQPAVHVHDQLAFLSCAPTHPDP